MAQVPKAFAPKSSGDETREPDQAAIDAALALLASLPKAQRDEAKKKITKLASVKQVKKELDKDLIRKVRKEVEDYLKRQGHDEITIAHMHIYGGNPDKPKAAKASAARPAVGWYKKDGKWHEWTDKSRLSQTWTKGYNFKGAASREEYSPTKPD